MTHRKLLMAGAIIGSVITLACSDTTGPRDQANPVHPSATAGVTQITFTKWFTTPPFMTGTTSYGEGTFAGQILNRTAFANGVIVQLEALYQVTAGANSFTAHIEGTENLQTLKAVLNGVVTEGAMVGSRVHVEFQVIRPCGIVVPAQPVCFQGTIQIQG
jgi:hypothetical protein